MRLGGVVVLRCCGVRRLRWKWWATLAITLMRECIWRLINPGGVLRGFIVARSNLADKNPRIVWGTSLLSSLYLGWWWVTVMTFLIRVTRWVRFLTWVTCWGVLGSCSDNGLDNFPFKGYQYTWERGCGSAGWVREKLNRILVSKEWENMFRRA